MKFPEYINTSNFNYDAPIGAVLIFETNSGDENFRQCTTVITGTPDAAKKEAKKIIRRLEKEEGYTLRLATIIHHEQRILKGRCTCCNQQLNFDD